MDIIGVTSTATDDQDLAKRIARVLIESKLIACAQIKQVDSIYSWGGAVKEELEYIISVKHPIELKDDVVEAIMNMHNYEIPQIIYSICETTNAYYDWCAEVCRKLPV